MNHYSAVFLIIFFSIISVNFSAAELEDDDQKLEQIINGQSVIFLDEESQKASGLEVLELRQIKYQAEYIAYGKAISISPLLTIQNKYLLASAKQTAAKARFIQAEKNISRLRNLHKNDVISTRKLQNHQTQWQSEKAIYNEMTHQKQLIINLGKLQWGDMLTDWLTGKHFPQFDKLLHGESILLKITLPANRSLSSQVHSIVIDQTGNRSSAFEASLLSLLPEVDGFSQGLQYLFLTDNPTIKPGMNYTAWIPQAKQKQKGVIIPESSLAWHLGQAFVFIKIDKEHFIHRNIERPVKVSNGYFVANQLSNEESIVVRGTQMLLSHEFRSQIPDEDDD